MSNYWKIVLQMLLALFEQILQIPPDQDHQPLTAAGKAITEKLLDKGGK